MSFFGRAQHDARIPMATMKALVKKLREPGLWLDDVPLPEYGINDVQLGPMGAKNDPGADGRGARVRRPHRGGWVERA